MYHDIQTLFEPQPGRPGWSAPPMDFRTAHTLNKGHGRREKRRIIVSSLLSNSSEWPGLSQVFKLERVRINALGAKEQEIPSGITSLPDSFASPQRLMTLVREHWRIENGLHYRRDRTMREGDSQLRIGHAPRSTTRCLVSSLVEAKPVLRRLNAPLPITSIVLWLSFPVPEKRLTLQQPWEDGLSKLDSPIFSHV